MNWYLTYKYADVPHSELWPYHMDSTNKPDPQTMGSGSGYYSLEDKINDNVSTIVEQMFPNAVPFGAGSMGLAYDIQNNRILKLTSAGEEAVAAAKLLKKPIKHVVKVYDIFIIDENTLSLDVTIPITIWGIIIEKVVPLTLLEQSVFNHILLPIESPHIYKINFEYVAKTYNIDHSHLKHMHQELMNMHQELEKYGYETEDSYSKNVGWRDKTLVRLDLGGLVTYENINSSI